MHIQGDQDEHDYEPEDDGLRSRLGRWWDRVRGGNDEEFLPESHEDTPAVPDAGQARIYTQPSAPVGTAERPIVMSGESQARRQTYRVASTRETSISVSTITNFGETQKVADRLKGGEPQIVNLEKTPPEVAERLIDFLNGVTYALDGYVEKIAEGAYLFTPSNVTIHAEGPEQPQPKPFFDRL